MASRYSAAMRCGNIFAQLGQFSGKRSAVGDVAGILLAHVGNFVGQERGVRRSEPGDGRLARSGNAREQETPCRCGWRWRSAAGSLLGAPARACARCAARHRWNRDWPSGESRPLREEGSHSARKSPRSRVQRPRPLGYTHADIWNCGSEPERGQRQIQSRLVLSRTSQIRHSGPAACSRKSGSVVLTRTGMPPISMTRLRRSTSVVNSGKGRSQFL